MWVYYNNTDEDQDRKPIFYRVEKELQTENGYIAFEVSNPIPALLLDNFYDTCYYDVTTQTVKRYTPEEMLERLRENTLIEIQEMALRILEPFNYIITKLNNIEIELNGRTPPESLNATQTTWRVNSAIRFNDRRKLIEDSIDIVKNATEKSVIKTELRKITRMYNNRRELFI